ncbi:UNVERIFIED_CONTAM: hypothetical protein Sradi_3296000 [Sesamum radiatum]|uniref:Angiotensin-converting enzyme 2 n=1 Tax=Sesamum radiatum TaxID=300843 RepID=A0AAW2R2M0_SESRA
MPQRLPYQTQVQNLIERCLQLYMNKDEVVKTLLNRARIDPGFTTLVWQKLEEENAEFFRSYYIRLKLKKQIILFNQLLEHQYHVMKYPVPPKVPLAPLHNGVHSMPVNNLPMGYPIMQQPPIPAIGQPHAPGLVSLWVCHRDQGCCTISGLNPPGVDCEVPLLSTAINANTTDLSPVMPPNNAVSSISDMPVSPASVASSGHFPFSASEISGMGVESSVLDPAFTSEVASSVGLQLPPDNGAGDSRDSLRSWAQIPWDFSLPDLTADLSNLGDSDILLDSPEQEDIVEEFFVDSDSVPEQCPPPDEEKL